MSSRSILLVLAVLLPVALLLTACQPRIGPLSGEDVAAIRSFTEQELVEALLAGDWDRFAASFVEDAVRMPPNEPLHRGRTVIKQWAEDNWGALTYTEFTMKVQDVDGRGDLAYAWGPYSATVEVPGLPEPVKDTGKYLVVLRKQEDGRWLASVAMFNSDSPPPGPPEAPEGDA